MRRIATGETRLTTTDPPVLQESTEPTSEWRAPRLPPAPRLSDSALRLLAVGAVIVCVLCTASTVAWRAQGDANRADAAAARASVVGATAGASELQREIDLLSSELIDLQQRMQGQEVELLTALDDRDQMRDQLSL